MEKNKENKILQKIKQFKWQEYVLIFAIIFFLIFWINIISSYQQMPSPVFGGDYYRDRGFIKNIVEGNPIWSDGFYLNELQYYSYGLFVLQAGISQITGMGIETVFLYFPIITIILGAITWYLLGKTITKNKTAGLVTALTFLSLQSSIQPKSSDFGLYFMIPLFLYLWIKYENSLKTKYAILSGVTLGSLALVHGGRFLAAASIITLAVIFFFIKDLIKKKDSFIGLIKAYFKKYYLIALISIAIAMIFFLPLILKYHMHSVNNVTQWGDTKLELLNPIWALGLVFKLFFNTSNVFTLAIGLIALLGFIIAILEKKNKNLKWPLLILITNFIVIQHHIITKPLLDMSFLPEKLVYLTQLTPLFVGIGFLFLLTKLKKFKKIAIVLVMFAILLVPAFIIRYNETQNSTWTKYGQEKSESIDALYQLADWITFNVGKDETILSNDESGFMLAVLSGRKVMLTRRTHASYYVDIDERIAEAAVAMYGNDTEKTKAILQKYNVQYFYLDEHLVNYPMRVRTNLSSYLEENGINFTEVYDRYDIAVVPERANMLNLLVIPPQQISESFMELFEPVYQTKVNGKTASILYKLK